MIEPILMESRYPIALGRVQYSRIIPYFFHPVSQGRTLYPQTRGGAVGTPYDAPEIPQNFTDLLDLYYPQIRG
jgi:hypothetical protein